VHGKPTDGNLEIDFDIPNGIKTLLPMGCKCWMPFLQHQTVQNPIFGSIYGHLPAPPTKSMVSAQFELLKMVWKILIDNWGG